MNTGSFTLPGESGYETLTLELARRWGADVIRDSDGTSLSDEILNAGYCIYSTICPVREHNDWIKKHLDARQQSFLCTAPMTANETALSIPLMKGFFAGQFEVNDSKDAFVYWQVYDRTTGVCIPKDKWRYEPASGVVIIEAVQWHQYTVSFLAWRIWEEISMYNHVTNNWNKEHLMQLNPYHREAREYLKKYMIEWCAQHPATTIVRFTSLFYNFVWIWGADERNRNLFVDWSSYDFTVCPAALDDFASEYGYSLTAEDFVRQGKYNAAHRIPDSKKQDWMAFIGRFVREAGKKLIDIVHTAGKKAYVFYDDNWLGLEPYNGHFEEFGFDGIIKCVFSGYEVRLCANVPAAVHEIRFHPYLFPVGLGGLPTFSEGGSPGADALHYWVNARRALLRQKIERCGLGGYLHLVQGYPDFVDAMDTILKEFRFINNLHNSGGPLCLKPKIAVLHSWGKLRSWTLSGHFHETDRHILVHILESLSGLPFDVRFLSFEDVREGALDDVNAVISAGIANDAWSGGAAWKDIALVEKMTKWVYQGGVFLGAGESSAAEGCNSFLRMAHIFGVDIDNGEFACHGKWSFNVLPVENLIPAGMEIKNERRVFLTDGKARVLAAADNIPSLTINTFGEGKGVYLSDFTATKLSARFLQNLILFAATGEITSEGLTDNPQTEAAVYPAIGKIVLINNSTEAQACSCVWEGKLYNANLIPCGMETLDLR